MVEAMGEKYLVRHGDHTRMLDGIFDNQSEGQYGTMVQYPTLTVVEGELPIPLEATVRIDGVVYSIREKFTDGDGFAVCTLRKE